jgi:hypothetical protein
MARDAKGHWLPGTSPNPGGRPKAALNVSALAREHGEEAILRPVRVMRGGRRQDRDSRGRTAA